MITMNTIVGFSILGIIISGLYVAIKAIDHVGKKTDLSEGELNLKEES